jgi:hypothetical protein
MVAAEVEPTFRADGLSLITPTEGLLIARASAVEVPPPGVELTAVIERFPAAEKSVEGSAALTWVELMKVVALEEPFTLTTVEGTNPVPVRVTTADGTPANAVLGDIEAITGAGLSTSKSIIELELLVPFETATGS